MKVDAIYYPYVFVNTGSEQLERYHIKDFINTPVKDAQVTIQDGKLLCGNKITDESCTSGVCPVN